MANGLRVRDLSGNILVEYTDRLTRIRGAIGTGTVDGSVTIPATGAVGYWFQVRDVAPVDTSSVAASISISANVIRWTFANTPDGATRRSVDIIYGEY